MSACRSRSTIRGVDVTALATLVVDDLATGTGLHASAEAVLITALASTGLISSFHNRSTNGFKH